MPLGIVQCKFIAFNCYKDFYNTLWQSHQEDQGCTCCILPQVFPKFACIIVPRDVHQGLPFGIVHAKESGWRLLQVYLRFGNRTQCAELSAELVVTVLKGGSQIAFEGALKTFGWIQSQSQKSL
jgi:hypothetical protein